MLAKTNYWISLIILISLTITSSCSVDVTVKPSSITAQEARNMMTTNLIPNVYKQIQDLANVGGCNTTIKTDSVNQTNIIEAELNINGYNTYRVKNGLWVQISWCD